jgi:hypothetical protein
MGISTYIGVTIECDECLSVETFEVDARLKSDSHARRLALSEARARGWEVWQECPPDGRVTRCLCSQCQHVLADEEDDE